MRSPSPLVRALRFAALLMQIALPAIGGLADAHHESDLLASQIHIEAENHECEIRGHPELCAICHFLRTSPAPVNEQPTFAIQHDADPIGDAALILSGLRQYPPSLPRGPPIPV